MNKLGKKYRTFGTDWLYISAVIVALSIAFRLWLPSVVDVSSMIANILALALIVGVFFVVNVYAKIRRPIFVLYDNALKVIKNGKESTYEWAEITSWDGMRRTTSAYFIPVFKYGANNFYQEATKIFSVSALTYRADNLVTFIISKMNEEQLKDYAEAIDNQETIVVGQNSPSQFLWEGYKAIQISQQGIGTDDKFYQWNDIKRFHFTKTETLTIKVLTKNGSKYEKISALPENSQYLLMGIIDHILGTAYLPEAQDYLMDYKQQFMDLSKYAVKGAILVALIMVFFVGIAVYSRVSRGLPIFSP